MRTLDAAVTAQFATREGIYARLLAWIVARDRSTGTPMPVGFWTGDDHQDFSIGDETRTYYGAGTLLSMPSLQFDVGLKVRSHRITFSPLAPEVEQALRGYDPRLAPAELHVAHFDPLTHGLLAEPARVFRGFVDTVTVNIPAVGGAADVEVALLSSAHALTRTLSLKKSHESLIARQSGDAFRQYTAVTGAVSCVWGEAKAVAPAAAAEASPQS